MSERDELPIVAGDRFRSLEKGNAGVYVMLTDTTGSWESNRPLGYTGVVLGEQAFAALRDRKRFQRLPREEAKPPEPPKPEPLRHDFTDVRGPLVFCQACGVGEWLRPSFACTPEPPYRRRQIVENEIGIRCAAMCRCHACMPLVDPTPRALPPLHSAHTQHLHALIGGWNRRVP